MAETASGSNPLYRQKTEFLIYMWFIRVDVNPFSVSDAVTSSDMLTVSRWEHQWPKTLPQQQNTPGIFFCACSIQMIVMQKKSSVSFLTHFCLADILWFILEGVPLFNVFYKRWFLFSSYCVHFRELGQILLGVAF